MRLDTSRTQDYRRGVPSRALAIVFCVAVASTVRAQGGQGPANPRLIPDISTVGDIVFDLSPKGSTQEGGARLGIREVELALQAAVDPFFRGEVFLGFSEAEGVSVEQAFLTATSLPWGLEARLGRILMPVGKQNTTHRHDLHTLEYPWALQRFLGEEGLKGTGVYLSKVVSPFGFYQEVIVTAVDRFGEPADGLTTEQPVNKSLAGMGLSARVRNYWDLTRQANLELSASAITGRREQPISGPQFLDANAVNARQSVVGVDLTYRWRPLQQGLYKSFILQSEFLRQVNEKDPELPATTGSGLVIYDGPVRGFSGWYAMARWQTSRRTFMGGRVDGLEDPDDSGRTMRAVSGYVQFFPSEFSKLMAGVERVMPGSGTALNRVFTQATFALGPHRPHPF